MNQERTYKHLWYPVIFVGFLWFVKWVEFRVGLDMSYLGVFPRQLSGLVGVLFSPLIHGDLPHLVNNSIPLVIMGVMLFYFYKRAAFKVWVMAYLFTGLLVWFFARPSYHIGASGLLYAITSFIFCSGLLRRHPQLIATSLLVAFLYGGMIWGVLPIKDGISWESHLMGGFVGLALAWVFRDVGPQKKVYDWEFEDEDISLEVEDPYWELPETDSDHTGHQSEIEVHYHLKKKNLKDGEKLEGDS